MICINRKLHELYETSKERRRNCNVNRSAAGHRTNNNNSELAIELPTCTAIASKASLNRPDKTTPTTAAATKRTALTNIKTQNNKSKKKYIVLQRKQQSTNQKRTICNKRHYRHRLPITMAGSCKHHSIRYQ